MAGPILLPTVYLYKDLSQDRRITRVKGTFSWNDWTDLELRVPAISLTMSKDDSDLVVVSNDVLEIRFRTADYSSKDAGTYRWQIVATNATISVPVPVGEGKFVLLDGVS